MKIKVFAIFFLALCTGSSAWGMKDPYNLERFIKAQTKVYATVIKELKAGKKKTHWIWYIFPQIDGLGSSSESKLYAIKSLDEARAYLKHPVLGKRLEECTKTVLGVKGQSIDKIFGFPDDMKFYSSMTLFAQASDASDSVFAQALTAISGGKGDQKTLDILQRMKNGTFKPPSGPGNNQNLGTNKSATDTTHGQGGSYVTRRNAAIFIVGLILLWLGYRYLYSSPGATKSEGSIEKD